MKIFVAVWAFVGLLLTGTVATAQPAKPTIVLVHGAFANLSSWYGVIAILERDGYSVVAAANPLRSVKGYADTVRALLASINTPVVLVGHSYGGMVISNAANGQANVKALVYVAAFAPEAGENAGGLNSKFPGSLVGPALAPPVPLTRRRPRPLCSAGKIPRCVRTGRARGRRETSGGGAEARHGHRIQ